MGSTVLLLARPPSELVRRRCILRLDIDHGCVDDGRHGVGDGDGDGDGEGCYGKQCL